MTFKTRYCRTGQTPGETLGKRSESYRNVINSLIFSGCSASLLSGTVGYPLPRAGTSDRLQGPSQAPPRHLRDPPRHLPGTSPAPQRPSQATVAGTGGGGGVPYTPGRVPGSAHLPTILLPDTQVGAPFSARHVGAHTSSAARGKNSASVAHFALLEVSLMEVRVGFSSDINDSS